MQILTVPHFWMHAATRMMLCGALCAALGSSACSVRGIAVNSVANAMAASGNGFSAETDPELVRDAAPFALKTMETLLAERPRHAGLLLALTRGFTQYAYAFVDTEALLIGADDPAEASRLRERARLMYVRALGYGLRALDVARPGTSDALRRDGAAAVAGFGVEHVPLLYWTAAAWGAAISAGKDDPALVADFPIVRALIARALELDAAYDDGALHDAMISLESVSPLMGGSPVRAREHFRKAVEMSSGLKAGPYVTLAAGLAVAAQDRREFETLLGAALAIDLDAAPRLRLANAIAQRRARYLLGRADYLFFQEPETPEEKNR